MRRLLIVPFVLGILSPVQADPLKEILKHTLRGGVKEGIKSRSGGGKSYTKVLFDKNCELIFSTDN